MNYQNGVMPTNEWFEKIKAHVDFKDKSVVDYGCAEGIMSILAKDSGSFKVIGIDNKTYPYYEGVDFRQEVIGKQYKADIKIFSMIIHWIGKEETQKQADSKTVIYIFREANSGYNYPTNGCWFPIREELDKFMKGF